MGEWEIGQALVQFGAAGLIGWMWLSERRWAQAREKQLSEAHERLMRERIGLGAVVEIVKDNTRAMTALEHGQRAIAGLIDRMGAHEGGGSVDRLRG